MTAALETAELSKTYGDAPALEPIDIQVAAGERIVLLGHNGSGKTTMLRLVAGLLEPSGGSARVLGHPVGSMEARAATSYLGDQPVFYDDLSVWEHLEYIAKLHGHDDWERPRHRPPGRPSTCSDRRDDLPMTFSRGLRQKAAIALAFIRPFELDARRRALPRPRPHRS